MFWAGWSLPLATWGRIDCRQGFKTLPSHLEKLSPRPLWERAPSCLPVVNATNAGEGGKGCGGGNFYPCHCEKIFDFRGSPLDCFVAFAPRNGMKLVASLPNPIHLHSHLEKLPLAPFEKLFPSPPWGRGGRVRG